MRFAVLDLGSSSFNLLVAEVTDDGSLLPVLREREAVRLGWAMGESGTIPTEEAEAAIETVARFSALARRAEAGRLLALATSALREAPSREALDRRLTLAAGGPVRFLDGLDEARYIFSGLRASVALGAGPTLGLDLGGGSLELAIGDRSGVHWTATLRIGAARLTGELVHRDPPAKRELKQLRERIRAAIEEVAPDVASRAPARAVVTGGTAGAVAALYAAERWPAWAPASLNQLTIPAAELQSIHERLAGAPRAARLRMAGVEPRRVDLLPAGSMVLALAADALGLESVTVSEWGLREGAILEELGLAALPGPQPVDLRAASVLALAHRWDSNMGHAGHVASLATQLFDETRMLHGLEPQDRELLGHAARMHDVGRRVSSDGSHKHGAYVVLHAGLRGFDPEEVAILASLVRFRRGSGPKPSFEPFAALSDSDRERVSRLTALLRLAHSLDRTPERSVDSVAVEHRSGRLRIRLEGRDLESALQSAAVAAGMLEKVLDTRIQLVGA